MMSLGKGEVIILSIKQNINGNILTEDEPIGVDDDMSNILW